jgi:uncharacterized protein (UPF0332 family)
MLDEDFIALANVRLLQARECLQSAEREIVANSFKTSANRSYYCIFHSMRAVLALDDFDSKKHSGVISAFRKDYIKTGVFPAELSDIIKNAFEVRNDSDYQDFYVISKAKVAAQIENAKVFLAAAEEYINRNTRRT